MDGIDPRTGLRRVVVKATDKVGDPEFLRGRSPKMMMPLLTALRLHRGVLTWLLPDQRTIGTPWYADPDPLRLTIVDDLDPAAAGPSSFDREALCWWVKRAEVIVVDTAKPHPRKLGPPALLVAHASCWWSKPGKSDARSGISSSATHAPPEHRRWSSTS